MAERKVFEVVPIEHDEDLPQAYQGPTVKGGGHPTTPKNSSLDVIKEKLGTIYFPKYPPPGYKLVDSFLLGNWGVYFSYKKNDNGERKTLDFFQSKNPGRPRLKKGYFNEISINSYPGYHIDGQWVTRLNPDKKEMETRWETGRSQTLVIVRESDWTAINLDYHSGSYEDNATELRGFAESLTTQ